MHPSGLPDDELNEIESHIGDASAVHHAIAEQCTHSIVAAYGVKQPHE